MYLRLIHMKSYQKKDNHKIVLSFPTSIKFELEIFRISKLIFEYLQ